MLNDNEDLQRTQDDREAEGRYILSLRTTFYSPGQTLDLPNNEDVK